MTKANASKHATAIAKAETSAPRSGSKLDSLLKLMLSPDGACLEDMTQATGWQPHTVRASMTALRKRGYDIDKRISGNVTVWFIASGAAQ